ncbi:hypothetical protein D9M72_225850 [compost metagenome]
MAPENPSTAADSLAASARACFCAAASLPWAACVRSRRKITGIIRNVEPLPRPVSANSTMNMIRKPLKSPARPPAGRKTITPSTAAIMPANVNSVTRAPPSLSDTQPPTGRVSEPTSGPRNA